MRNKVTMIIALLLTASMMASCSSSDSSSVSEVTADSEITTTTSEVNEEVVTTTELSAEDIAKQEEQEKQEQERSDAISIEQSINDGDYEQAYSDLMSFQKSYGKDDTYKELKDMLQKIILENITAEADQKRADGSIIAAVEYVEEQTTYYSDFEDIQALYDKLTDEYVDSMITQAQNAILNGDFEGSLAIIEIAKTNIGYDNEKLNATAETLAEYQPTYLFDLNLFNYSGEKPTMALSTLWKGNSLGKPLLSYETHSDRSQKKIMDSAGNEYKYYYYVGSAIAGTHRRECFAEYLINGKYDVFSGVVAFPDDEYGVYGPAQFVIYGDGEELYRSPVMDRGSKPEAFSVDIKGVDVFRIQFYPLNLDDKGEPWGTNGAATIFDGAFYNIPTFE